MPSWASVPPASALRRPPRNGIQECLTPEGDDRSKALNIFVTQLVVNFFWSLIFFNAQAYGFAVLWLLLLWGLLLWMVLTFYKVDPLAAYLQLPYLQWLTFAAYLNIGVWQLTP